MTNEPERIEPVYMQRYEQLVVNYDYTHEVANEIVLKEMRQDEELSKVLVAKFKENGHSFSDIVGYI